MGNKRIAVLGSTGSIGRQALDVADFLGAEVEVTALAAAGSDIGLFLAQIKRFRPRLAVLADERAAGELSRAMRADSYFFDGASVPEIMYGSDGLCAAAAQSGAETVVFATSGTACLPAVISAVTAGKTAALANKEALVMAGGLIMGLAGIHSAQVIPVDSEHSAIFQCLRGRDGNGVKRLILTASGGPFLRYGAAAMEGITPEQASAHPVWRMGKKISIDSATLANKGLEVIEASRLFGMDPGQIDVLVHPEGVIHSMVEYHDNAIVAQIGSPDMRLPIQYALTFPERRESLAADVDFAAIAKLTFEQPDTVRFPCLRLAYDALREGGTMTAAYNAANEAAVSLFTDGAIGFTKIPEMIEYAMNRHTPSGGASLESVYAADSEARVHVHQKARLMTIV